MGPQRASGLCLELALTFGALCLPFGHSVHLFLKCWVPSRTVGRRGSFRSLSVCCFVPTSLCNQGYQPYLQSVPPHPLCTPSFTLCSTTYPTVNAARHLSKPELLSCGLLRPGWFYGPCGFCQSTYLLEDPTGQPTYLPPALFPPTVSVMLMNSCPTWAGAGARLE